MEHRRQFDLLEEDESFLKEYGRPWECIIDGSPWILIHNFAVPAGYNHTHVTVAIRIETGYPNAQLDMAYFYPALSRTDGRSIGATEAIQSIDGKNYQRWSRHRTPQNPWVSGRDNLGTHVILIEDWLEREFEK